jgi:hypothetical protein
LKKFRYRRRRRRRRRRRKYFTDAYIKSRRLVVSH